ncbi:MAG: hypothetical protein ACLQHL_13810, partial [Candidatus Cybelea sp.]
MNADIERLLHGVGDSVPIVPDAPYENVRSARRPPETASGAYRLLRSEKAQNDKESGAEYECPQEDR